MIKEIWDDGGDIPDRVSLPSYLCPVSVKKDLLAKKQTFFIVPLEWEMGTLP